MKPKRPQSPGTVAGWDVEWRVSDLYWVLECNEYCGVEWLQWNLFRRGFPFTIGRIKQVQRPGRDEMWAVGQHTIGTLELCVRALIDAVKGFR